MPSNLEINLKNKKIHLYREINKYFEVTSTSQRNQNDNQKIFSIEWF